MRVKLLGGTEPLIILLLGAFAVMLVITLASEPWKHPDRMSIFGTLVAVAALLWSGANTVAATIIRTLPGMSVVSQARRLARARPGHSLQLAARR